MAACNCRVQVLFWSRRQRFRDRPVQDDEFRNVCGPGPDGLGGVGLAIDGVIDLVKPALEFPYRAQRSEGEMGVLHKGMRTRRSGTDAGMAPLQDTFDRLA